MNRWPVLLLMLAACPAPAVPPAVLPQRAALTDQPARFVLAGRIIAKPLPGSDGEVHLVVVGPSGIPARLWVRAFTHAMADAGTVLMSGDRITAWCQVAERDTVADSVRVEP